MKWSRPVLSGMRTLTLRIYLTVVAVLLLFAFVSGWLFQHHIALERVRADAVLSERMAAWGDLIQRSLPEPAAAVDEQALALREWSQRLRLPLALDDGEGRRIAASESFRRRAGDPNARMVVVQLEDGRRLWVMRPGPPRGERRGGPWPPPGPGAGADGDGPGGPGGPGDLGPPDRFGPAGGPSDLFPFLPPQWPGGLGLLVLLVLLFLAVAGAAWPVAMALTRRLQALKRGVEQFGAGELSHRVEVGGRDEVAAVAASFNQAAGRIEALVRSHQSLLANASHELRSPLARLKMAVAMLGDAAPGQRELLKQEIHTNIAELDALVEEVLLASRLDAQQALDTRDGVDLLGLAAEEAVRVGAQVEGEPLSVHGEERLLRRALRNLLENAQRYGGDDLLVLTGLTDGLAEVRVCDRGPGVPAELRERIFEPFYRLPGHAEKAGGVGLGLSLVRQIAQRHGGTVACEPREGGGSCFVLRLPVRPAAVAGP